VRGPPLDVWVDPASLAVLQTPLMAAAFEWLRSLHTNLLLEGRTGRSIVGYAGIGLILLAGLGVPLWWPARGHWREAFVVPATRGRVLHRRLHGAAGAWSVLLLLVMAATGVVTAFPQTARATLGLPQPPARRPPQPAGVPPSPAEIDRAVVVATAAAPGLLLRLVVLPPTHTEPIRILLMPYGAEGVSATVSAAVDAEGRLASLLDARTMPTGEQALRWAHDLHFGHGLGTVWQMLTVLTGLVLPVFGVTGAAMWLHRRRGQAPVLQPGE